MGGIEGAALGIGGSRLLISSDVRPDSARRCLLRDVMEPDREDKIDFWLSKDRPNRGTVLDGLWGSGSGLAAADTTAANCPVPKLNRTYFANR